MIKVTIVETANILLTIKNNNLIKFLRQDHYFSTRLPYAKIKIRENWMNMVNTTYNTTEDMINKLQSSKGKTKILFYKNIGSLYDEMKRKNFRTQEDPFSKDAQAISKIYHEVLLLKKFLQSKSLIKNMNINYYDLYYTVIKSRKEKDIEIVNDNDNDYIKLNVFITPNHYVGNKPRETILK